MEDILSKMAPDKKYRLLNSSFEEFSKNSYEKASTNTIVKNAKISKGLLYHYFKTKESLYDYLVVFSYRVFAEAILSEIDWNEKNLVERIFQIATIKLKVLNEYPYMANFTKIIYTGKSIEELKEIMEENVPNLYHEVYYKNIDFTLFKEGIDPQKAIQITQWVMEKYSETILVEYVNTGKDYDFDKIKKELYSYLIMLKTMFNKG